VLPQVEAACELLGLDPLYVANEGKLIAICAPEVADTLLAAMRAASAGGGAQRIGTDAYLLRRIAPALLCADGHAALAAAAWWIGSAASSCRGFAASLDQGRQLLTRLGYGDGHV
jgi:hypothetical protein